MITVIRDTNAEVPFQAILENLGLEYQIADYKREDNSTLLADPPEVILLYHSKALVQAQALSMHSEVENYRKFRILMFINDSPEASSFAVRARMAGADDILILPQAEQNVHAAIRNAFRIAKQIREIMQQIERGFVIDGRFHVIGVLGGGPHGVNLSAIDKTLNEEVSIKLLNDVLIYSPEQMEEYRARISDIIKIKIPEVGEVLASTDLYKLPYIVYHSPRQKNLYEFAAQGTPPETTLLRIAYACTKGLLTYRNNRIAHLNLKPENILCYGEKFILTDFGILTEGREMNSQGHGFWCSKAYMAPEFYENSEWLTSRSDVFSLGMVLYTIAARENPILGRALDNNALREAHQKIRDNIINLPISDQFKMVLKAMLDPRDNPRPRLVNLEIMLTQMIELDKMRKDEQMRTRPELAKKKAEQEAREAREMRAKIRAERRAKGRKLDSLVLQFLGKHVISLIFLPIGVLLSGYICYQWGKSNPPKTHFQQGPRRLFTCFSGHSSEIRTLDERNVFCPECHERTTLSYTCQECGKVYGLSIWPLRDMTEGECNAFEEKLKHCPYCASTDIFPTPLKTSKKK